MLKRFLTNTILKDLKINKIILILGARQVGKTTLLQLLEANFQQPVLWINGDEPIVRREFEHAGKEKLQQIIGENRTVFFDEAQRIPNIGLVLKILYDNFKNIRIVVTGSSAFDLSDKIKESLAGRKFEYKLYPFSFEEILKNQGLLTGLSKLDFIFNYGLYPEVFVQPEYSKKILLNIIDSYLFKDIFQFEGIRKPELIEKLTQALALQIGNEISYNEISNLLAVSKDTVQKYITFLEQNFIVFRLSSFTRNNRRELKRRKKVFFWDLGIRNALLQTWSPPTMRPDFGNLWENFLISERLKALEYHSIEAKSYFWRTTTGLEIDYIEVRGAEIFAYEIKWNPKRKVSRPSSFLTLYPKASFSVITKENFTDFTSLKI